SRRQCQSFFSAGAGSWRISLARWRRRGGMWRRESGCIGVEVLPLTPALSHKGRGSEVVGGMTFLVFVGLPLTPALSREGRGSEARDNFGGHSDCDGIGRHVFEDDGVGADLGVVAYRDA